MASVDLTEFGPRIELPDRALREAARNRLAGLAGPGHAWLPGADRLGELAAWFAAAQGAAGSDVGSAVGSAVGSGAAPAADGGLTRPIRRPRLIVFAGDHGVAAAGISAHRPDHTAAAVRATATGGGPLRTVARTVDVGVRVIDMSVDDDLADVLPPADLQYKICRGSNPIDTADALGRDEAERAFLAGVAVADAEVDSGADLLLATLIGVGASTAAAVLTAALTRADAAAVTGRGSGIDDAAWIRKCAIIRDALRRARPVLADQLQLLATAGGADFAALCGFVVQSAVRRTPAVVDGFPAAACGLVGQRMAYRSVEWWLSGSEPAEAAHRRALDRMRLVEVAGEAHRLGPGVGSLLAVPTIRAAVELLAEPLEKP